MTADLHVILAPNPSLMTGPGTNSVVVGSPSQGCVVIDPGSHDAGHLTRLGALVSAYGGLSAVLITHSHPDHTAGALELSARFDVPVYSWMGIVACPRSVYAVDGLALLIGSRRLVPIYTPGHSFDHLAYYVPDIEMAIVGDLVSGMGTVVISPPDGDLDEYLCSIDRLRSFPLMALVPGHGPTIDRVADGVERLVTHRAERDTAILRAISRAAVSVGEIVASVYRDVDHNLHDLAAQTVTAHLIKLERDGLALRKRGPDLWIARWSSS